MRSTNTSKPDKKTGTGIEHSLKLNEAWLAGVIASAMDAIITVDENQNIVLFNSAAETMFRCSTSEALGGDISRFIPTRFRDSHKKYFRQFGETKITQRSMGNLRPISGLRSDGEEFPIEASISQVDIEGKKLFTVIIRDISESKRLEAQFLRAQRMESIGTLAGGIAHDLNNVLSPILTAIELLQMRLTDESSRRLLDILHTNALRGSEMIKQVLMFARGVEGEYSPLKPTHLINDIIRILKDTLPKNIDISLSVQQDLWNVMGDATQLHQVLMNMCVNARDAMPKGGKLRIDAENVDVDEHYARMNAGATPGNYVRISVIDNGIGITDQNLSKIFDPFFTTKDHGHGTGLGLSTAAGIIRSHGGFVGVYSEVNKGTQFKVYLPASKIEGDTDYQHPRPDLPFGNDEMILVVDDESSIREIASETLTSFGYRVVTANDGAEALAQFASNMKEVKVVILDMMMPIMDGPSTIRALKRMDPEIKIIASSGLKLDARTNEAAQLGIKTFLSKPYTAETLLKTLAEVLEKDSVM